MQFSLKHLLLVTLPVGTVKASISSSEGMCRIRCVAEGETLHVQNKISTKEMIKHCVYLL